MTQFDVFENPITRARRAYPFVAILQADLAATGRERIVAPLARRDRLASSAGRLTPQVKISGVDHVLLVPGLTAILASDLRHAHGTIAAHRDAIVAALDYLFLGI